MYSLVHPAAELAPYIENYWLVAATPESPVSLSVDVFVDGRADLIFNFGAPYQRGVRQHTPEVLHRSNLDAQRLAPIRIVQRGHVLIAGVRFRLGGVSPFVRHSLHAWTDRVVSPTVAFGADAGRLEHTIRDALADSTAVGAAFDAFFRRRLLLSPSRERVYALTREITAAEDPVRIERLLASSPTSTRNINRWFRQHLGFGPKTVARIARFQRALRALQAPDIGSMAELAVSCGYYDHPHFVRDFQRFAGTAPREKLGYFPAEAPRDFSPNLVQFVQDSAPA